jgi:SAM-dependent methyltransferase
MSDAFRHMHLQARDDGGMKRTFDELVAEADSASVVGWDFAWLDGRATEERPSWGYQRLLHGRLAEVTSALDIQTGGGEVLAGAGPFPPTMAATEPWPPNLALATRLLHPLGVVVVAAAKPPLPFADAAFDLLSSRHPADLWWDEIARVLKPGGTYFAQHVGAASVRELVEYFVGPQPEVMAHGQLSPDVVSAQIAEAGLDVVDLRHERLRIEFFDVGAVIYFLRKVIWAIPGFTVAEYRDRLLRLHQRIEAKGPFITHSSRVLIEARKPA